MNIRDWCKAAFETAKSKGFHGGANHRDPQRIASRLALIHAEVSEVLEAVARREIDFYYCDPIAGCYHCPHAPGMAKPEGLGIELADVALRLFDLAGSLGIDLEEMIEIKHEYNKKRPIMHGGKCL